MRTVLGLDHPWGRKCPYFAAMGIALRMYWHDVAKAMAVVRRGGANVDVHRVSKSVASFCMWLAQDSAETGPNLRFLVTAIDEGDIKLNRR
jgi:hypothetical protein